MKNMFDAVIANVEFVNTSTSGWKKYNMVFEGGREEIVVVPPDCPYLPQAGHYLVFTEGQFGSYIVNRNSLNDKGDAPIDNPTAALGGSGASDKKETTTSTGQKTNTPVGLNRNTFWDEKYNYEVNQRDPQIALQTYFNHVMSVYAAALPHLTNPPTTTADVDTYIDDAFAKAKALHDRVVRSSNG